MRTCGGCHVRALQARRRAEWAGHPAELQGGGQQAKAEVHAVLGGGVHGEFAEGNRLCARRRNVIRSNDHKTNHRKDKTTPAFSGGQVVTTLLHFRPFTNLPNRISLGCILSPERLLRQSHLVFSREKNNRQKKKRHGGGGGNNAKESCGQKLPKSDFLSSFLFG